MIWLVCLSIVILTVVTLAYLFRVPKIKLGEPRTPPPASSVPTLPLTPLPLPHPRSSLNSAEYEEMCKLIRKLEHGVNALATGVEKIPTKTLNTIQGSVNTTAGKLGELITFIELQRSYDRFMMVGNIVDFIGIRFPQGDTPGAIEFIDVKTGDKAVLNPDQKKLKNMIENQKDCLSFKVVKVELT